MGAALVAAYVGVVVWLALTQGIAVAIFTLPFAAVGMGLYGLSISDSVAELRDFQRRPVPRTSATVPHTAAPRATSAEPSMRSGQPVTVTRVPLAVTARLMTFEEAVAQIPAGLSSRGKSHRIQSLLDNGAIDRDVAAKLNRHNRVSLGTIPEWR